MELEPRLELGTVTMTEAKLALAVCDSHLASLANWIEAALLASAPERHVEAVKMAKEREQVRNVRALFAHAIATVEGC